MLTVKQLPNDLSGCGWYDIASSKPAFGHLKQDTSTQWLIIGAGIAGLSAAKRLADNLPNQSITVIDAQRIAWSACGRNSGFMIDLPHELQSDDYGSGHQKDLKQIQTNRSAIDFAASMANEFKLGTSFQKIGKYHAATDGTGQQSLQTFSKHLTALGESFDVLSQQQMRDITGSDYYSAGIFTPHCAVLQPAQYILDIANGINQLDNVTIYDNSPALTIDRTAHNRYIVTTPTSTIQADNIILTVNGHLESFSFYNNRSMPIYTFSSMTKPLTQPQQQRLGGLEHWALIPAHPMGTTVRKINYNGETRIVIRNTFTYNANKSTTQKQIDKLGKRHAHCFHQRFPMLNDVGMQYRWGGHLCLSLNSVPIFGELQPRLFAACCHNGLGLSKGTLGGMLIADLAAKKDNAMVSDMLAEKQPTRLPPKPLMSLGANAYLKWTHHQASSDL